MGPSQSHAGVLVRDLLPFKIRGLGEDTYPASAVELVTVADSQRFFDVLSPAGLLGVLKIVECHISLFTSFVHVSPNEPVT